MYAHILSSRADIAARLTGCELVLNACYLTVVVAKGGIKSLVLIIGASESTYLTVNE